MRTTIKALLLMPLLSAAIVSGEAHASITSFETSEGFTPNSQENTAGWTFSDGDRIRVSDGSTEPALTGQLSIYAAARASGEEFGTVVATNWNWVPQEEHYNQYSFSFTNPTATAAGQFNLAWVYIRLWDEGTHNIRDVQIFVGYGLSVTDSKVIRYRNGSDDPVTVSIPENANIDFADWINVRVVFDFEAAKYQVYVNNVAVGGAVSLPNTWNVTGIVGTQLVSPRSGTTYYDDVRAVLEPASLGYLGLAGKALARHVFSRRHR